MAIDYFIIGQNQITLVNALRSTINLNSRSDSEGRTALWWKQALKLSAALVRLNGFKHEQHLLRSISQTNCAYSKSPVCDLLTSLTICSGSDSNELSFWPDLWYEAVLFLGGKMNFWDNHGLFFILAMAFFPRLTLLFSSVPFGGVLWWLGFVFAPRILVAVLATMTYLETNPILVTLTWIWALSGETVEKKTIHVQRTRFRTAQTQPQEKLVGDERRR